MLVIDEAQNLSPQVLEQVRLLSNLETETDKLLQIVLIGQPELGEKLALHELRQPTSASRALPPEGARRARDAAIRGLSPACGGWTAEDSVREDCHQECVSLLGRHAARH